MIFSILLISGPLPAIDPKIEECRKILLLSYQKLDEIDELLEAFEEKLNALKKQKKEAEVKKRFRLCR